MIERVSASLVKLMRELNLLTLEFESFIRKEMTSNLDSDLKIHFDETDLWPAAKFITKISSTPTSLRTADKCWCTKIN